jgi:hypothetical protein
MSPPNLHNLCEAQHHLARSSSSMYLFVGPTETSLDTRHGLFRERKLTEYSPTSVFFKISLVLPALKEAEKRTTGPNCSLQLKISRKRSNKQKFMGQERSRNHALVSMYNHLLTIVS